MNKEKKIADIEVGKRLRALRLKKDVSEHVVAKVIGRNTSTYSRFESGTSTLSDHLAEVLADYYEVDVAEIKPAKEAVNIENSFHNSPTSGNINSVLIPNEMMNAMHEIIKQNSTLLNMVLENQKTSISDRV